MQASHINFVWLSEKRMNLLSYLREGAKDIEQIKSFFDEWSKKSIPISQDEFDKLDTLEKFAYETFESIITDTSYIGIKPEEISGDYILLPNSITIGIANGYRKNVEWFVSDSLIKYELKNFRPRVFLKNKKTLYYTKEYQDTLPKLVEKYGVGSFIEIDRYAYYMSNEPRYIETTPKINRIYKINSSNEVCIQYDSQSRSEYMLIKKMNKKWIVVWKFVTIEHD